MKNSFAVDLNKEGWLSSTILIFFSSIPTPHYLLHNTCLEFELKKGREAWQQKERDKEAEREIKGGEMEGGNERTSK